MKPVREPIEISTGNGALPIRCFTGDELLPDQTSRQQLAELATLPGLDDWVTVLPDVHFKRRNPSPTGTVVVSRSCLVPRAIHPVVTAKAVSKGQAWLGTLGAGNHFLELQQVVAVLDGPVASRLGLYAGDVVCMMHTDSRRLGKYVLKSIFEEALHSAGNGHSPHSLWTIPADSEIGRRYVAALSAATHAGFANRAVLTGILRRAMRAVLGDPSLELPLIYDCAHE